jgi:hypothetical protein
MTAPGAADVDRDALLCALVLSPVTFARNRFFALFNEPWARRTRSRAAQLRTIVRHFSHERTAATLRELSPLEGGGLVLRYGIPRLSLERTAILDPLEIAVVRFALSRSHYLSDEVNAAMMATEDDRRRVETALAKLGRKLGFEPSDSPETPFHPTPTTGDS